MFDEDSDDEDEGLHDSPAVQERPVCSPQRNRDNRRLADPRSAIGVMSQFNFRSVLSVNHSTNWNGCKHTHTCIDFRSD